MDTDTNYKLQGYLNKQEKERLEALKCYDSISYYSLCTSLGIDPEDTDLYEQGMLESMLK